MGKAFNSTQRAKIARGECVEMDCTSRDVPVELSGGRKQVRCRSCQAKRRAIQQGDTTEKACGCGKPAVPLSNQCTKCMLNDDAPETGGTKTRDDLKALQRYLQKVRRVPMGRKCCGGQVKSCARIAWHWWARRNCLRSIAPPSRRWRLRSGKSYCPRPKKLRQRRRFGKRGGMSNTARRGIYSGLVMLD